SRAIRCGSTPRTSGRSHGFTPPAEHRQLLDILPVSVGTDRGTFTPLNLALRRPPMLRRTAVHEFAPAWLVPRPRGNARSRTGRPGSGAPAKSGSVPDDGREGIVRQRRVEGPIAALVMSLRCRVVSRPVPGSSCDAL